MMSEARLLTIDEVAEILSVSSARAYQLARSGTIPVVRLGRQVRVDSEKLRLWIERGGTDSTDQRDVLSTTVDSSLPQDPGESRVTSSGFGE